jgi:hypothetical protein
MLLMVLAAALGSGPAAGAPAACAIVESSGIAAVQIGMPVAAALSVTGPATRQEATGNQVVYTLRAPWAQMVATGGVVSRIGTRASECRTPRGVGPGSTLIQIRQGYAGTEIATTTNIADGQVLSYPFLGIAFTVKNGRVDTVEVFRADSLPGSSPAQRTPAPAPAAPPSPGTSPRPGAPAPSPTPTAAQGTWSVRSTSVRVDDTDLIVSGIVDNRSRGQNAYAEVVAFSPGGQRVGEGNAPVQPSPVPAGGSGTFEVRMAITDVVARYVVTIRAAGAGTRLADSTGQIRSPTIFGPIVSKRIQVQVQARNPNPTRSDFVVSVTNGSGLAVSRVVVAVDIRVICRLTIGGTFVEETWSGSATAAQLRPGGAAQAPLSLAGGVCQGIASQWTPTFRVTDIAISEQQ